MYSFQVMDSGDGWRCLPYDEFEENAQNCANNYREVLVVYVLLIPQNHMIFLIIQCEDIYIGETAPDPITGNEQQIVVKYSHGTFLSSVPLLTFSLEVTTPVCDGNYLIAGAKSVQKFY